MSTYFLFLIGESPFVQSELSPKIDFALFRLKNITSCIMDQFTVVDITKYQTHESLSAIVGSAYIHNDIYVGGLKLGGYRFIVIPHGKIKSPMSMIFFSNIVYFYSPSESVVLSDKQIVSLFNLLERSINADDLPNMWVSPSSSWLENLLNSYEEQNSKKTLSIRVMNTIPDPSTIVWDIKPRLINSIPVLVKLYNEYPIIDVLVTPGHVYNLTEQDVVLAKQLIKNNRSIIYISGCQNVIGQTYTTLMRDIGYDPIEIDPTDIIIVPGPEWLEQLIDWTIDRVIDKVIPVAASVPVTSPDFTHVKPDQRISMRSGTSIEVPVDEKIIIVVNGIYSTTYTPEDLRMIRDIQDSGQPFVRLAVTTGVVDSVILYSPAGFYYRETMKPSAYYKRLATTPTEYWSGVVVPNVVLWSRESNQWMRRPEKNGLYKLEMTEESYWLAPIYNSYLVIEPANKSRSCG